MIPKCIIMPKYDEAEMGKAISASILENSRGVDVGAKAEFYRIIAACAQQGMAVIVISSELPEVIGLSDRIIVMREGRISGEVSRADFSEEIILKYAMASVPQNAEQ